MTRVEFFFNVENKPARIASLAESACKKGRKLMVFAPDASTASSLERYLWTYPPIGFLPNCNPQHRYAEQTPIIVDWQGSKLIHDDVLINLQTQHPPFFSRFRRLIEIVGVDEADKADARIRYRFYRDRGYEIRSFDANGASL